MKTAAFETVGVLFPMFSWVLYSVHTRYTDRSENNSLEIISQRPSAKADTLRDPCYSLTREGDLMANLASQDRDALKKVCIRLAAMPKSSTLREEA